MRGTTQPRLAVLYAVALLVAACGSGSAERTPSSGSPSPTPSAPATAVSPAATPRPVPPPTGIAEVDAVIRATLAGDVNAIMAMVQYERVGCVVPEQEGSPPGCTGDEAPGTPVDAFPVVACGGGYERPDGARRSIDAVIHLAPPEVYTVFRPSGRDADYRVVFDYAGVFERNGFTFDVKGGRIIGLYPTCQTVVDATRYVSKFVIPPPYGPHARAPRHLHESSIAEFVPTPYNTFIVTGSFDHSIEEAGQPDAFAWSIPASLIYDGNARWWLTHWQRGEVFDCAESCTVALTQADADARITALHAGDPVCVIGWTDDVGKVEAEAVYLHPPTPCRPPADFFDRPTAACLLNPGIAGQRVAMIDYPSRELSVRDVGWSSSRSGTVVILPAETPGSSYAYTEPTLAPSEQAVVVGANLLQPDGTFRAGLWSFDLGGGAPRLIYPTDNGQTFDVDRPAFSPDGSRIAFTRIAVTWRQDHGHDDRYEVWVMDADGSNPRKAADGRRPQWSDDGQFIVYDTQSAPGATLTQGAISTLDFTPAPTVRIGPC